LILSKEFTALEASLKLLTMAPEQAGVTHIIVVSAKPNTTPNSIGSPPSKYKTTAPYTFNENMACSIVTPSRPDHEPFSGGDRRN
jgi:hypothetical protein